MKFNIKSAVKYSSALKNIILEVENSLRVNNSLVNRFGGNDEVNSVPAANNGIYKATITHQKSKIENDISKKLDDEVINVEATGDFTKIDPATRLQILNDLIVERTHIDYEIEQIKNNSKIVDEFSGKELTYDLGCQINSLYREYKEGVLKPLVDMESKLTTTINGKTTIVTTSSEQASAIVTYPIQIEADSKVDSSEILKMYDEVNNKCNLNSDKLSEIEISKYFEYEPKFNLNPSIRSLINQYEK